MKLFRNTISIIALLALIQSCKKDEIMHYESGDYVQFNKSVTDSSMFSFLALPDDNEAKTPLVIELVGKPSGKDRQYKISVANELSTATPGHYSLPASFTLRANRTTDTAWLTVKKLPDLKVKPVRLVLRIESTDELKFGQIDYCVSILNISNVIAKPDWWNQTVEWYYLGEYSDKKFALFIQVTGLSDINSNDIYQVRYYTMKLKNYLLQEKDAGRTVYEENGQEMTVEMIGG
ncbi:DUF4843 domain-containing protein [Pseudoflavitalea sp. G-6-1-2]|uniref:DUF4843 domain-containing protein n=1 Tax=Pseudoflavitalea sp. G-6-1-2 TaxID=2728841 RepID=UPI00146C2446|nr:DUF4843 domain-containing protein [Pseudoflavitalea sp. G-6-1-2]NML22283.1 DUF4843 domain-containing protein [Pseudoflavitalea sp. G-6-1-2]